MLALSDTEYLAANGIIVGACLFTIFICGLAFTIIAKTVHLRSTTFGDICSVQMVSDILLILLNTVWCIVKAFHIHDEAQSRYELLVGVVSKTFYFFTCKLHVLMAINRYIFIFHATENPKTSSVFRGAIFLCFLLAFLQSFAGPLLDPNLFVVFSSDSLRWKFATTEWTPFYEAYLEYYLVLTECSIIIILDSASFKKLRQIHRKVSIHRDSTIAVSKSANAREMRLLLQSFCQLIPLSSVMVFFFFVAPKCDSSFLTFLSSTAAWHFGISLDGVIIVLFQAKFRSKPQPKPTPSYDDLHRPVVGRCNSALHFYFVSCDPFIELRIITITNLKLLPEQCLVKSQQPE
ncbi:hypothetical protein PRIPAC_98092, partial [Pristionchus pacificus]|uniref:G protein-coupled receptor n=1 Tax=Pristionchus pacificus TaxID=54126 RepID=A0A2A6BZ13_PRIPA